jgi:hypothetical protein
MPITEKQAAERFKQITGRYPKGYKAPDPSAAKADTLAQAYLNARAGKQIAPLDSVTLGLAPKAYDASTAKADTAAAAQLRVYNRIKAEKGEAAADSFLVGLKPDKTKTYLQKLKESNETTKQEALKRFNAGKATADDLRVLGKSKKKGKERSLLDAEIEFVKEQQSLNKLQPQYDEQGNPVTPSPAIEAKKKAYKDSTRYAQNFKALGIPTFEQGMQLKQNLEQSKAEFDEIANNLIASGMDEAQAWEEAARQAFSGIDPQTAARILDAINEGISTVNQ